MFCPGLKKKIKCLYLGVALIFTLYLTTYYTQLKLIPMGILCLKNMLKFEFFQWLFQRLIWLTKQLKKKKMLAKGLEEIFISHVFPFTYQQKHFRDNPQLYLNILDI